MWVLEHYPADGPWTKEFSTLEDARVELLKHICAACLAGGEWEDVDENGVATGIINPSNPPDKADIYALLDTPCGCEYGLHESDLM